MIVEKLKELYLTLNKSGTSENDIIKICILFLDEELNKLTPEERDRFYLSVSREKKLSDILKNI